MLPAQAIGEPWIIPLIGLVAAGLLAWVALRLFHTGARRDSLSPGGAFPAGTRRWRGRDRRAYPRTRAKPLHILYRTTGKDEAHKGHIVDRSLGGIGIELQQEVDIGDRLQLRLTEWDAAAAWVTVEVRHCLRRHGAWHAGCRLVDMTAWEGINIFGPPDPDD